MTATTDAAGHPDVEELSDLSEGLLPPSRTADVRRHLDDCVLCADTFSSLEEIRVLMGALPGPPRMPDDVAHRIDAALAAEALLNASAPDTADAASPKPLTAHVSRETASSSHADRPSGHARAATGPGRTHTRRGRRRTVTLAAVFAAAAVGLGALLVQTLGDDTGKTPTTAQQHTDAAHTYAEGTLKTQVANLLAGTDTGEGRSNSARPWGAQSEPGTTGSTGMERNKTLEGTTVNVPPCIQQAIHTNQTVLAADKGVYQGTAVYLVVTPDASDSTKVTAYLIDAACAKQASASSAKVLLTQSYTRS